MSDLSYMWLVLKPAHLPEHARWLERVRRHLPQGHEGTPAHRILTSTSII